MDKRQHQRIHHVIPAEIRYVDRAGYTFQFKGEVQDISVSGVGVRLTDKLWGAIASRARVELALVRTGSTARWAGYVARMLRDENGSDLLGIVFDRPRYDIVATLKDHVSLTIQITEDIAGAHKSPPGGPVPERTSWFEEKH